MRRWVAVAGTQGAHNGQQQQQQQPKKATTAQEADAGYMSVSIIVTGVIGSKSNGGNKVRKCLAVPMPVPVPLAVAVAPPP